ncbi:MAG TPA: TerB family tellurite resistance protein [Candidatus Krumholzibacteria bacterium]|nr:TerB family tellurite resistance protein [Candidatus Krumholzibacteria bacterium]
MGLLGALFGGTVGFMIGGPLGALIGGTLGAQAGGSVRMGDGERLQGGARRMGPQDAQQVFLVAVISLAAKVCKADGRVSPEEVRAFDAFLKQNLGMPADERRHAALIFNEARDSDVPASAFARQIGGLLRGQPDRLRDIVTVLLHIAHADGVLHPAEEQLIHRIALDMGLNERDYQQCRAFFGAGAGGGAGRPAAAVTATDYEVLGLTPQATDDEVKKAYRRIAREYHPDVLQSKGLPEDFMNFAKEKLQTVNEAYDRIKRERGM